MPAPSSAEGRDFREPFLAELLMRIGEPSGARPTVRCWSESALSQELVAVRKELEERRISVPLSGAGLLAWLQELKLARAVPVESPESERPVRFFVLGLERFAGEPQVDPIELLQAYAPQGVVCYFTALAFHALTTQPPSHHHVAVLAARSKEREAAPPRPATARLMRTYNPLGKLAFRHQGVPYFLTRRESQLVPGVQQRYLNSRALVRITSREQTLLDTLHRPLNCGGPEVVFEAWRTGVEDMDASRLAELIVLADHPHLRRRVAAMLDLMDYPSGDDLRAVLERGRVPSEPPIPLLAGMEYSRLDPRWCVLVPG